MKGKRLTNVSPIIRAGQNIWDYFCSLPVVQHKYPSPVAQILESKEVVDIPVTRSFTVEFDELLGPNDFIIR